MFDGLRDAVIGIDEHAMGLDELINARSIEDVVAERVNAAIDRVDADGTYVDDGAPTIAAWLRHKANLSGPAASRQVRIARKLRVLEGVRPAWATGVLSTGHVEAIIANVKQRHVGLFVAMSRTLIEQLRDLTVDEAQQLMAAWASIAEDHIPGPDHDDPTNSLHLSRTLADRGELKGTFDSELTTILEAALALFDSGDRDLPAEQRRADALAAFAQFALDHHQKAGTRRNRPHVTIVLRDDPDGEPVAETPNGRPVRRSRVRQWMCDATFIRMIISGGQILDHGRAVATVPTSLWQATAVRDRGCRFPCCGRPVAFTEAHHVVPFSEGGDTSIPNLALFCSRHHHMLHDNSGWTAQLHPDGQIDFTKPDGTTVTTYPPDHTRTLWPPGTHPPDVNTD